MAKKPTINSSLFKPTVPKEEPTPETVEIPLEAETQVAQDTHVLDVTQVLPVETQSPAPMPVSRPMRQAPAQAQDGKELTHNTSTRIPLPVHEYFEDLAVDHGYSTHSLRIYALTWFVREHRAGNIRLERDRSVRGKRVLEMPRID